MLFYLKKRYMLFFRFRAFLLRILDLGFPTSFLLRRRMMMMMMNGFCGMIDRQKVFSLISSRNHCQRSSPWRISDMPRAGFEPAQNLSSGFDKMKLCNSDNHYTTAPHTISKTSQRISKYVIIWLFVLKKALFLTQAINL